MLYTHIINMHIYTYTCRIHIDTIIKMCEDFLKNIPLTLLKGLCVWEELETEQRLQYIDPHSYGHQRCVFLPLLGGSTGGPGVHSAWCWLPLPHLVTNGSPNSDLVSKLADFLSSPSYIIVQSSTQYLWNGMFDRHQAEITVMQLTGHSLPLHQSMNVHWDFNLCPILSFKPAYAISSHNCIRNVSLPSGASLWNGMFGRVEGQYTTHGSLSCSVWLGVSGFPEFIVSVVVVGVCWCVHQYIFWWISSISRLKKQPFFVIVLTWSACLWFVASSLPNVVQISIILFRYPLYAGLASNITV